jgi:hypothetical protein
MAPQVYRVGQVITYDVIILSYRRPQNLAAVVASARGQSVPPSRVVVVHNAPSCDPVADAENILFDINAGCRARHAVGQLSSADAVVFIDDDVALGGDVCAALLASLLRHPESVVGIAGRRISLFGTYNQGHVECSSWHPERTGTRPGEDQPVSIVKGRVHAARRTTLPLAFRHELPPDVAGEDDVVLCAEATMDTGAPGIVAGGIAAGWIRSIPDADRVGNEFREDHFRRRVEACRYMQSLGWNPQAWQQGGIA